MVTDKPIEAAIPSREFALRAPESARADVLSRYTVSTPTAAPGDRAPFDSRTHGPQRGKLLLRLCRSRRRANPGEE